MGEVHEFPGIEHIDDWAEQVDREDRDRREADLDAGDDDFMREVAAEDERLKRLGLPRNETERRNVLLARVRERHAAMQRDGYALDCAYRAAGALITRGHAYIVQEPMFAALVDREAELHDVVHAVTDYIYAPGEDKPPCPTCGHQKPRERREADWYIDAERRLIELEQHTEATA